MKLHKLTINNIASLVEATVDFSSPELSSEPIFLITGDTGSGKTTILNAICIVLYDRVPSLDGASKEDDNKKVKVNSPLQFVRRNCKEASISLEFSDKAGTFYTVEWHVKRITRGENKGKFNPTTRFLSIHKKGCQPQYYTKTTEITPIILSAIGLTFEQFCRTTMLAQGQFLKFIDSDNNHKSDILEKITGTEFYSKVGAQIFAITKRHRERYSALENQIKGARLLSEETKQQLTNSVAALTDEITKKTKHYDELMSHVKWLEENAKRQEELQRATEEYAEATTEDKALQISQQKQTIADWSTTAELRDILKRQADANNDYTDLNNTIIGLKGEFDALAQGLAYEAQAIENCKRQIADNQSEIDKEKPFENIYGSVGTILALIDQAEEYSKNINRHKQNIQQTNSKLQGAIATRDKAQQAVNDAQEKHDEQQVEVNRLTKENENIDFKTLNDKKEAASAIRDKINKAITAHSDLTEGSAILEEKKGEAEKAQVELDNNKALLATALAEKDRLLAVSNDAESRYQGQMDLSHKLTELTHIFKDTHKCPLCGSDVEHLHTKDFIDAAVKEAKKIADKAKNDYDVAFNKANGLETSVKSLEASIKKAKKEVEHQKTKVGNLRAAFEAFGLNAAELEIKLFEANSQYDSASQALTVALDQTQKQSQAEKELTNRRNTLDALKAKLEKANVEVKNFESNINNAKTLIANIEESKTQTLSKIEALLATPHPELQITNIETDLPTIKVELPRLKANYEALAKRSAELAENIRAHKDTWQTVDDKLKLLASTYGNADPTAAPREYPNITNKANVFYDKVARLNGQIQHIISTKGNLAKLEAEYFESHSKEETMRIIDRLGSLTETDITNLREATHNYDMLVATLKGSLAQLKKSLNENLAQRPATLAEEQTLTLATEEKAKAQTEIDELKQERTQKATLLSENDNNERILAQLKIDYDQAQKEYLKWDKLNKALGKENGEEFKRKAQAYIFGLLLRSANTFLSQLTDRYSLEGDAGSLIIYVIDHHDGNNKRVAKGLSGGEGFMASLALALALSTINQELDPLDILFIDEGFGTLDPSIRESTINMLCSLSRRVCLISHMPELRERIHTQIRVIRKPGTSRSTIVIKTNA